MKPFISSLLLTALVSTPIFAAVDIRPKALVAPSAFKGVHGLAVDHQGRLLAGSVVGSSIYKVDIDTGEVQTFIGPDQGQADDIAIGPKGEMAWTAFTQGKVLYRENDQAPIRVLAENLPGINSIAFNQNTGQLFASQVFLGDALWEVDVSGEAEPRLIAKDMGGFNGFEVGGDDWVYGPLWFKGQVVRINPVDGEMKTVAEGFETPAAVNFNSKGELYVVDTEAGTLIKVDVGSGKKVVAAELSTSLDNLAIDAQDHIFVSNMADNSIIQVNPDTGEKRTITEGELAIPAGLVLSEDGKTVYIADFFAFRSVDTKTGQVTDIRRAHGSDVQYPTSVGLGKQHLYLTGLSTNVLQIINRNDLSTAALLPDFNAPSDAIELADGSVVVSEMGSGSLIKLSGPDFADRSTLVTGLNGPVQMALGKDGQVYLTEASGFLTRIDPVSGQITRVAKDLAMPEGLAQTADGQWIVAETAAKRLTKIDLVTGQRSIIAKDLPIGLAATPSMPPSGIPTGVAVDQQGTVYFGSDIDNGLYRLDY